MQGKSKKGRKEKLKVVTLARKKEKNKEFSCQLSYTRSIK